MCYKWYDNSVMIFTDSNNVTTTKAVAIMTEKNVRQTGSVIETERKRMFKISSYSPV